MTSSLDDRGTVGGTLPSHRPTRPARTLAGFRDADGALPSDMAAAGLRALLVTDRSAAWLPWSRPQVSDSATPPVLPGEWDDKSGTRWTPDLVHCRLVETGRVLNVATAAPSNVGSRAEASHSDKVTSARSCFVRSSAIGTLP